MINISRYLNNVCTSAWFFFLIIISICTHITLSKSTYSLCYWKIYHQPFILHNIFITTIVLQVSTVIWHKLIIHINLKWCEKFFLASLISQEHKNILSHLPGLRQKGHLMTWLLPRRFPFCWWFWEAFHCYCPDRNMPTVSGTEFVFLLSLYLQRDRFFFLLYFSLSPGAFRPFA